MKKYKIYCLKNPNNNKIRYIGVTTKKYLSSRLSQHWYCANHNHQTHVAKWIRKIGIKPIIELIEICEKNIWEEREKYWIKHYDNLTNIHEGGKGIFIDRKQNSIERSAKSHEIKIVQLNDNGNLIKIWDSVKKATKYFNGKSNSSISNVLNNNYGAKKAFGYQWFYYNDYIKNNYKLRSHKSTVNYKNIQQVGLYDLNNNLIKVYKSLNLLSKDIGLCYSTCRKNKIKQYITKNKYYIRNYKI